MIATYHAIFSRFRSSASHTAVNAAPTDNRINSGILSCNRITAFRRNQKRRVIAFGGLNMPFELIFGETILYKMCRCAAYNGVWRNILCYNAACRHNRICTDVHTF